MSKIKPGGWVEIDEEGVVCFFLNCPDDTYFELPKDHPLGKGLTREDDPKPVYLSLHSPEQINELVGAAKDTLDGIKRENEKTGKHDDTPYQMEDMVYDLTKALKLFTGVE